MGHFDVILAGTSPIILLEALHHDAEGKGVLILEKLKTVGGAWASKDVFGYRNIEVGCHYLHFNKKTYNFLQNKLNLKLVSRRRRTLGNPVTNLKEYIPNPALRWLFRKFYRDRLRLEPVDHLLSALTSIGFIKFKQGKRNFVHAREGYLMKYPRGGCGEMIEGIMKMVNDSRIQLRLEHEIQSVSVKGSLVQVQGRGFDGSCALFIGGESGHYEIAYNGTPIHVEYTQGWNQHLVLKVKGGKLRPFSYLNIHKNKYLKRVSDVAQHAAPSEEYILCCQLVKEKFHLTDGNPVFKELKKLKIFSPESELIDCSTHGYKISHRKRDEKFKINKACEGRIRILDTYDLSKSIGENLGRWNLQENNRS